MVQILIFKGETNGFLLTCQGLAASGQKLKDKRQISKQLEKWKDK